MVEAGTYDTVLFQPSLAYTVAAGWANFEDEPGNFLLVPPNGDLGGANAGTSDFIGVYTNARARQRLSVRPGAGSRQDTGGHHALARA
jgi:hypothetical protein